MSFKVHFIVLTSIILTVVGCGARGKAVLSDISLKQPGWMGIDLGQINQAAITGHLRELDFVKEKSITITTSSTDLMLITWTAKSSSPYSGGRIWMRDNIVECIAVTYKKQRVVIEDVLDQFGAPDKVMSYYQGPEWISKHAELLFLNDDLWVINEIQKGIRPLTFDFRADNGVKTIVIFPKGKFADFYPALYNEFVVLPLWDELAVDWEGYGEYKSFPISQYQ